MNGSVILKMTHKFLSACIVGIMCVMNGLAQKVDTIYADSVPKKILYDNKIYKLNAGFFTLSMGPHISNNIDVGMKGISLNFNFHYFRELYMQVGLNRISGDASYQYPDRKAVTVRYFNFHFSPVVMKSAYLKFAFIFVPVGITYGGGYKDEVYHYIGKLSYDSTNVIPHNYFGVNLYSSVQCVYKFKYDLGVGIDMYAMYQPNEMMIVGLRLSFYFSAAFRGNQTKPAWYYKKNPDKN